MDGALGYAVTGIGCSAFSAAPSQAEEAFRKNLPEGQQFGFLPKPFSLKQLIEKVKSVIVEE